MSLWNLLGWYWLLGIATWFLDPSNTSLPWGDACQGGKGSWKVIPCILLTPSLCSANTTRSSTTISEKRSACAILVPWLQLVYGTRLVPTMSSVNVPRSRVSKRLSLGCTPNSPPLACSLFLSISIIPCTDPPSPHPYFSQINQHYLF